MFYKFIKGQCHEGAVLSYTKNGVQIEGYPRDEHDFKNKILDQKRVYVVQVFSDGRRQKRIWNASRFSETSNLKWNLETGYASPKHYPGVVKAYFAIDEADLPNSSEGETSSIGPSTDLFNAPSSLIDARREKPKQERIVGRRIAFKEFLRDDKRCESHLVETRELARSLLEHMCEETTYQLIRQKDVPRASSSEIQDCILKFLESMDFRPEAIGLFEVSANPKIQPDYYRPLGNGETGIIVEVERGKTINNNMDILDVWKCHICKKANYLFLIVPRYRASTGRAEFEYVSKRVSSFFKPENYTNVYGLWLFGY